MISNTEIKIQGYEVLRKHLGLVEMEKFISLIQEDRFDYTKWRQNIFEGLSGEEISKLAMQNLK